MKSLLPNVLGHARRMLHAMAMPARTARSSADRSGWPAPSDAPLARRRNAGASSWSPNGPSGEWKRRSLDRFGDDRRG
jgi:hypothetical protein